MSTIKETVQDKGKPATNLPSSRPPSTRPPTTKLHPVTNPADYDEDDMIWTLILT